MTIPDKLKSRKLWNAVAGEIAGVVTLFWGAAASDKFMIVAGAVLSILVILGYLYTEGQIDKESVKGKQQ